MAYSQPTTIEMPMSQSHAAKPAKHLYGWVVGWVLVGHLAAIAGLAQLEPKLITPPEPKPVQIRLVELAPPPPPPQASAAPAAKAPDPVQPKTVAVAPPPPPKAPPRVMPTVAPTAKPVAKPTEPVIEPVSKAMPVLTTPVETPVSVVPVVTTPAPVVAPQTVVAAQPVTPNAPSSNPSPRTVAIDGVAYKRQPQVQYPEQARRRGDTGTVLVRALIGTSGRVESATLEQGSGNRLLDQAALRAVNRASFHPYKENGIPQSVYTLIPIAFTLNED